MRKIKALYEEATVEYIQNRRKRNITVNGAFFRDVAIRRWPALLQVMRLQRKEQERLYERLRHAKSPETRKEVENTIDESKKRFFGMKAGIPEGEDKGAEELAGAMSDYLRVENRYVD